MDCVKFGTVMSLCGAILFVFFHCYQFSLYFILKYQPQFYRYGIKDQSKSEISVLISGIFYLVLFFVLLFWGRRRDNKREYNNLPAHIEADPGRGFFDEKQNVSIEQNK